MRGAMGIAIICCALFASGCSTVPSLQDASGESGKTGPLVTAVINSVKCEIGGALKKLNKSEWRGNTWIRNWAVKADITLIVVNTAGIAPTVSYTKFFGNAFNFDAGSSSLTSKVIAPIQQFLTFGAGVNYSESATRQETVSFTLTHDDLKQWGYDPNQGYTGKVPGLRHLCETTGRELRGELGLAEWLEAAVDPALQPIRKGSLGDKSPINSIGHLVTFVIVEGGNVGPNWSMKAWRGPTTSGNLATLSRTRTNTLNLAFGPRETLDRTLGTQNQIATTTAVSRP